MNSTRIEYLKNRLLFILEFLTENSVNLEPLVQKYERLQSEVTEAFKKNQLTKLERYNKDFNELVRNIPELKTAIDHRFNEVTDKETDTILEKIQKKALISNREEYEIVKEKVNYLYQTESDKTEIEKWNNLLLQFENNVP